MSRRVRRHPVFGVTVAQAVRWLSSRRSAAEVHRLRVALERVSRQPASYPGLGREVDLRAGPSVRVIRLGRLPYLVWYSFDPTDARAPVWLLLLMHEKQDRARFDPGLFDGFVEAAARKVLERSDW